MEKIVSELNHAQNHLDNYRQGPDVQNYENTLDLLELAAERLIYEIAYFRAKKATNEKVRRLKYVAIDKQKKV